MEAQYYKICHYAHAAGRNNSLYWSHATTNSYCTSVICDDLNAGLSIEQIWKKTYTWPPKTPKEKEKNGNE